MAQSINRNPSDLIDMAEPPADNRESLLEVVQDFKWILDHKIDRRRIADGLITLYELDKRTGLNPETLSDLFITYLRTVMYEAAKYANQTLKAHNNMDAHNNRRYSLGDRMMRRYRENYKGLHKPQAPDDQHIATYNGDYFIGTMDELKDNGGRRIKNDDFVHELTLILIQRPVLDAATRYLQDHNPDASDTEYARKLITTAVKALSTND